MKKFYFDITETFIKTFAVIADDENEAFEKIQKAWEDGIVKVPHNVCDDVIFEDMTEDIEEILGIDIADEEIEVINPLRLNLYNN